jgi:L-alanine-DL-glutamate epimerase-like enolase superfamily enzyme
VRITAVETLSLPQGATVHAGPIQWLWVRIHTDSGLIGLRETYPFPAAEAAVIHRVLADRLLGQDPSRIEFLWNSMFDAVAYAGWAGAGIRAISAVDIALWDIKGKALRVPVFDLLGGATRDRIRTYNTCYDRISFLDEPVRLAESLYDSGIRAMKIWPFDGIAKETGGNWITEPLIDRGIEPLVRIRERFGSSMEVALEFHGYWNVPGAIRIAQACEPLRPMWLEEMLPQDNMSAYKQLAEATSLPLTIGERLMTVWQYRELVAGRTARIVMPDISWCGGLTQARRIADLAAVHYLPVAPHNCGGPVLHAATLHFAAAIPNLYIAESVRRHYADEYRESVGSLADPVDGFFALPPGPGLGIELEGAILERPDLERQVSRIP